jgi:dihydroorotate dehydrogenase electron transfer subunit
MQEQRRSQFVGVVKANLPLCRDHYRLTLRLAAFPASSAGQFVQIACRVPGVTYLPSSEFDWEPGASVAVMGDELRGPLSLLRKPFSIAGREDTAEGTLLHIIHRTVGTGTTWMGSLKPGDEVNLLGPLGNSFPPPPDGKVAILVGGGVGIPPMIYFASRLVKQKAVAFAGSLTRDLLPLTVTADAPDARPDEVAPLYNITEFSQYGVPAVICTDDGSFGFRGFVTQALEIYLDRYFAADPSKAIVYTCGPEAMMRRVADIALARRVQCYVSVERAMACGMGTCQSCVIRVSNPSAERKWSYKLACTDGPIFDASALVW